MSAGGEEGAAERAAAGQAADVDEDEIRRVASLMRIDIGEEGGEEARSHIEKVRTMIGYFDMLDRAGGAGAAGAGAAGAGLAGAVQLGDLREDEPAGGGAGAGAAEAGRYARVQTEGGTYVRAPAMSP